MASSAAQSKKQLKRSMTKKSYAWWWNSHICPKNSKWLVENVEKMDDRVKHMLVVIEEDSDSFAKKAQMYYQKRPELIQLVGEFYRMYRTLAERYDQVSGELQKNHDSSEIQSQSSLEISSATQEKLSWLLSGHKEEADSSSLTDLGSESDHSYANDEDSDDALIRWMTDIELELEETKQKLQQVSDNNVDLLHKITVYEGELGEANEKIRTHEEEIANLKIELQSCMSTGIEDPQKSLDLDKEDTKEDAKVQALEEELSIAKEKVQHFEKETYSLRTELESSTAAEEKLKSLQHELELAQKNTDSYRNTLNAEQKEVSKLQKRLAMLKTSLQDRENEIRALKTVVSGAEQKIIPEKAQIKGEMSKLLEEQSRLGEQPRELESHIRLITEEKAETEKKEVLKLQEKLAVVKTSLRDRDNEIRALKTDVSDAKQSSNARAASSSPSAFSASSKEGWGIRRSRIDFF